MNAATPVRTFRQLADAMRCAPARTSDDVCITLDGQRLDTKERLLAFLTAVAADLAAAGRTVVDKRMPPKGRPGRDQLRRALRLCLALDTGEPLLYKATPSPAPASLLRWALTDDAAALGPATGG